MDSQCQTPKCFQCLKFSMDPKQIEPKENEVKNLELCKGCQFIFYCSEDCKSKNEKEHKKCCEYIQKLQLEISEFEANNNCEKPLEPLDLEDHYTIESVQKFRAG